MRPLEVLATTTGLAGHTGPLLPILTAYAAAGARVRVVVPAAGAAQVAAAGLEVLVCPPPDPVRTRDVMAAVAVADPVRAAALVDGELFPRHYSDAMLPATLAACAGHRPDLVVREPCAYAGAIAATRLEIPHCQVAISLSAVEHGATGLALPALAAYGLGPGIRDVPLLSRFPARLDPSPFPDTRRYGETPAPRVARADPLVYATLGTVTPTLPDAGVAYRALLAAVADLAVPVLLTIGDLEPADLGDVPGHVEVARWRPQAEVVARASVVVCHGGSGTVLGALAAGVPMVLLPLFADQPRNAAAVAAAGAGLVVAPPPGAHNGWQRDWADDAGRMRRALDRVHAEPSFRFAAEAVAADLTACPDPAELVGQLIEELGAGPGAA